jgi:beta-N-acetylhexosaminidase
VAALRSSASPRGPEPATEHATESVVVPHVESHESAGARSALAAVGAEAAERALRVDGALPEPSLFAGAHVVELDRPANIAAGAVPWGVGAPLRALATTATTARVSEGNDHAVASALVAAADRSLVVVVRDAHRRPAQAAALATLAAARPDAVVVDMGWPGNPTDRPAVATWITTHGASRASGEAVARVLAGAPTAVSPATSGRTSRG